MKSQRIRNTVALLASGLLAFQAVARPPANIISLRSSSYALLEAMWSSTASSADQRVQHSSGLYEQLTRQCGRVSDLERVVERTSEAEQSIAQTAQGIYRSDVIEAVLRRNPGWRIRLSHAAYGAGLWSGDLDDDPPLSLPREDVEAARKFANRWFTRTMSPIICDAARTVRTDTN